MKKTELLNSIAEVKTRSAWSKGVKEYAYMIVENAEDLEDVRSASELLNGAENWTRYSYGGCALAYDGDIAETLCTPSQLKKNRHGQDAPNDRENWCDIQAKALNQAARLIDSILTKTAE